ncbi:MULTISPECIES: nuclear transport factor 2 family protein [Rufibacter]|uniref:Ketosteroid isomerase-like protein n=1 Tax=Rufibacter quisquiliarum TaxID=1549639 RepID=A0A839GP70_9BACT|nr:MULTISPECIES: nuclear transport factor 2 family protein [Rufibacter]MBA9076238.1 ketosteroid isomerase-like protein [Rufibacter quisquiliarum]
MKPYLIIIALVAFLSSCSKTAEKQEPVNVQQLNQTFIGAWNSRNSAQLDTLLAEDVHFVQGEVHFNGKSEVSQKWVRETLGSIENLRISPVATGVDDSIAFEGGTFTVDVIPTDRQLPRGEGEGNFVLIWKKNDKGAWKLFYAQLEDHPVQVR